MSSLMLFKPLARSWTWLFGKLLLMLECPRPVAFTGERSLDQLADMAVDLSVKKMLLVTDEVLVSLGLIAPIEARLTARGISAVVYSGVLPDPSFAVVNEALKLGRDNGCDGVMAIGGGSTLDTAKVVSLAMTNCSGSAETLEGQFKAKKAGVTLLAVPTTAGTGAEVTMGAVISDSHNHTKKLVVDTKLIPAAVALDPLITAGAPAKLTAIAGVDALSHAIEGYVSVWATPEVKRLAETTVAMIFRNLEVACREPDNLAARESMLVAAHMGGLVINRATAGYIHAISHQLGSLYKLPHGSINAAIMADVLLFSRDRVQAKIARLALKAGLGKEGQPEQQLFDLFISGLKALNTRLGLDNDLRCIKRQDIPAIVRGAMLEANSTYGVPRYMDRKTMTTFLSGYCA